MNPIVQALLDGLDDEGAKALAGRLADEIAEQLAARGAAATEEDGWLDSAAAARYLGVTKSALQKLTAGRQVPFAQEGPGCKCWFKRSQLDRWRRGEVDPAWKLAGRRGVDAAISLPIRRREGPRRAAS